MNQRVSQLHQFFLSKAHRQERAHFDQDLAAEFAQRGLTPTERVAERLSRLMEAERPVIFPEERIVFTRTVSNIPPIFTEEEWQAISGAHFLHEAGFVCNVCPGYEDVISGGLLNVAERARGRLKENLTEAQTGFYAAVVKSVEAVLDLSARYQKRAAEMGRIDVAQVLSRVPAHGARTFHEALQFFRILHYTLWLEGEYHNTIGRFDQFMYPYYRADVESGRLTREEALELLEEFFLSFNKDSDLYMGVQQGDNGQSLVLGGTSPNGEEGFNPLSELCLTASQNLKMIDPKINMRVGRHTPFSQYQLGTRLTRDGLGFPQYESDDVVIPGLTQMGYRPEDAQNYVVAACWEFIIPRYGMDIPNIGAMSYPKAVEDCLHQLGASPSFESFLEKVGHAIQGQCEEIIHGLRDLWMVPAPFLSVMMDDCLDAGRDISLGGRYNNYGIHGTGLSTAADSLMAVKRHVFEEKTIAPAALIDALNRNFEGCDELSHLLRYETPKMGMNEEEVDAIAVALTQSFAHALSGRTNERGGCFRPGTGSAMYYLWHAQQLNASADGRRKGEPFGANYSPSLFARIEGPLSIFQSFTKPDLKKLCNGGPLTLELHSSVFAEEEGIAKVAALVKRFIEWGGHQLQLNAVNRETLLKAQQNPGEYERLIVRVWGWSAYFVELDKGYQDHVIERQEHVS